MQRPKVDFYHMGKYRSTTAWETLRERNLVINVHIRATDPGGRNLQTNLTGRGFRFFTLVDREVAATASDFSDRRHSTIPESVSWALQMFGSCQFLLTVGFKELSAVATPPQLFIVINTQLYCYLQRGMRDVAPRFLAMLGQHDDFLIPLGMRRCNTSFF